MIQLNNNWSDENTSEFPKVDFRKKDYFEFKTIVHIKRKGVFYEVTVKDFYENENLNFIKSLFQDKVYITVLFFDIHGFDGTQIVNPSKDQNRNEIIVSEEDILRIKKDPTIR